MAWTVAFALLGALLFSMLLAPVLSSILFRKITREWENPVLAWVIRRYRVALRWSVEHRWVTLAIPSLLLAATVGLVVVGAVGSEFLPHLDEGAIWARGTLAPSTGPTEGEAIMSDARIRFARFPEVTQVVSQVGRPDDGTDTTGFFNTEYFIDLKPKDQWRPEFREDKEALMREYFRFRVQDPDKYLLFDRLESKLMADKAVPQLLERLHAIRASNFERLDSIIRPRIADGTLADVPPEYHVCAAWVLAHGASALSKSAFYKNIIKDPDDFFDFLMYSGLRMGNRNRHHRK